MYTAIFLDIDNTLLDFDACAQFAMRRALIECALPCPTDLWLVFKRENDIIWRRLEKGEITKEQLYRIRWSIILEALGLDGSAGPQVETRFAHHLARHAQPMPGAAALLAALRALPHRPAICAASNGPWQQQHDRLADAGLLEYFDHLFISEDIGFSKPDPRYFDACFARLRATHPAAAPGRTIMLGDSLTADIRGAAAYGIATCWYDPAALPCPAGFAPDHTVTHLTEFIEICRKIV